MTEKNDFKLDVVSIRLVKEAPIYSEQSFNKPEEVAAVMGECMCQFDREVVCVVNLSSDLKEIDAVATALVEAFISNLEGKGDLEKAAATIAQGIKDYSTDKRGR